MHHTLDTLGAVIGLAGLLLIHGASATSTILFMALISSLSLASRSRPSKSGSGRAVAQGQEGWAAPGARGDGTVPANAVG